jgi:hypothetical protein
MTTKMATVYTIEAQNEQRNFMIRPLNDYEEV